MRTTINVSAITLIISIVFIYSTPALAAGTGTVSPTSGHYGTTTGNGYSAQTIQQALNNAEAKMKDSGSTDRSGNIGTASESSAALYQAPFASNPGTMAESAKTTALSTSTYHQ
jgi:hypothetical protein